MIEMFDRHMLQHITDLGTKITAKVNEAFDGVTEEGVDNEVDLLLRGFAIDPEKVDDGEAIALIPVEVVGVAIVLSTCHSMMIERLFARGLNEKCMEQLIVAFEKIEGHDNRYWIATAIYELYWAGRRRNLFYHELLGSLTSLVGLTNVNQNYIKLLTTVIDDIRANQ